LFPPGAGHLRPDNSFVCPNVLAIKVSPFPFINCFQVAMMELPPIPKTNNSDFMDLAYFDYISQDNTLRNFTQPFLKG